jgi:hypothetical protein
MCGVCVCVCVFNNCAKRKYFVLYVEADVHGGRILSMIWTAGLHCIPIYTITTAQRARRLFDGT